MTNPGSDFGVSEMILSLCFHWLTLRISNLAEVDSFIIKHWKQGRKSNFNCATSESRPIRHLHLYICRSVLLRHDFSRLRLADAVKFTENTKAMQVEEGLWKTITA